jgi:hypothetical protein
VKLYCAFVAPDQRVEKVRESASEREPRSICSSVASSSGCTAVEVSEKPRFVRIDRE